MPYFTNFPSLRFVKSVNLNIQLALAYTKEIINESKLAKTLEEDSGIDRLLPQ